MSFDRPHQSFNIAPSRAPKADTFDIILGALNSIQAKRVLDIGCGHGDMAAKLGASGFAVTGIDPLPDAITIARTKHRYAKFMVGSAENPPVPQAHFDAAYFLNSLHHVPHAKMRQAILAALSLVAPSGIVIIVEPLATGSFFRAMRPVEDETEVRAQATATMDALITQGEVELITLQHWDRENRFQSLQAFCDYLLKVDPLRAKALKQNAAKLAKSWRENVSIRNNQALLMQPMICWIIKSKTPMDCK